MFAEVDAAFSYFEPGAFEWQPPATEAMIANAEQILNVQFSPSLRLFYKRHNGFCGCDATLLSLPLVGEELEDGLIDWSINYRDEAEADAQSIVTLVQDGTGNPYSLLPTKVDERGESPIVKVDHETLEIDWIVASSFERFLWFFITDLQRYMKPNGEFKEDDELDEDLDGAESAWYENLDYLLQHDPHLAQWRS